uniref:BSD domain-containing protein n=1 Tax=Ananas comosus var. bracteatus TaxID=296719 RepID=A0A6V7Q7G6_ANACO|nr:unnamed protein product [Ananas comosus var. bracteatus]
MGSPSFLPWPFSKRRDRRGGGGSKDAKAKHGIREKDEEEEAEFGVTDQLLEFVKTFTVDTFKSFPLHDPAASEPLDGSSHVRKDLTDWQQRHALLLLSKAKEIAKLRYVLCPRHLKDNEFWRIYFLLVKSYVAPYEINAIKKAKIKMMEMENGRTKKTTSIEVEMAESRSGRDSSLSLSSESKLDMDAD